MYIVFASLHNNQKVKNRVSFVAVKAAPVRHLIVFKIGPLNAFLNKLRRIVDLKMSMTDLDSDLEYLTFFYVSASLSSRVSYSGITRNFFNNTSVVFEHL